jgi:simple sugar transport system permease protein
MVTASMAFAGFGAGALWIGMVGALRAHRGVNETISGLLLTYIAIALLNHLVEGPMRDPESLNKPSTRAIAADDMLRAIPGLDVHWGLVYGLVGCALAYVLMDRSTFGFGASVVGGNVRAGLLCGLPVRRMMVAACALGGGAAGLAGMVEVAAVHGRANESLVAGYGYTGVLVSFLARHDPAAVVPVAVALGGIGASNGLLQRMDRLPDATVGVLQGILFVVVLASETLYGRFAIFRPRERPSRSAEGPGAAPAAEALG